MFFALFDGPASVTATIPGAVLQGSSLLVVSQGISDLGQLMLMLPPVYEDVDEDELEDLGCLICDF